jgi:hypothetical protein
MPPAPRRRDARGRGDLPGVNVVSLTGTLSAILCSVPTSRFNDPKLLDWGTAPCRGVLHDGWNKHCAGQRPARLPPHHQSYRCILT